MIEWEKMRLGDLVEFKYGKGLPEKNRLPGQIPVYSSAGHIGWHQTPFVKSKGIVIGRKGSIGTIYKSNGPFFPIDTTFYIEPNKIRYDFDFIFYYLKYLRLDELNEDSAVPGLNRETAHAQEILRPPLPEQKAIAGVLSALDDKLDLLQRQNHTLEALAQTLFLQWFIEEADEDWQEKPLSFFGKIVCGKTPSKRQKKYFGGDIPFIKIPDMRDNIFVFRTSDSLTIDGKKSQENKTLPERSICVSCIATVGLVSMNAKISQTNQQINTIIPNQEAYRYYLYFQMKSKTDLLHALASGGTATLNLNTGAFSNISIPHPNSVILNRFQLFVEPIFNKIFFNQIQMNTLEKLRDMLLPKLMSGQVRVRYEQDH